MRDATWVSDVAATPGSEKPDPILVVDGLQRFFGGLRAVDVQHLQVQRNSITSLLGPNGAGKTTLFNVLTGFDRPDSGSWQLNGGPLVGLPAYQVARRGMVRTFQLTRAMPRLTVTENVMLAATGNPGESLVRALIGGLSPQERAATARGQHLLVQLRPVHKQEQQARNLSGRPLMLLTPVTAPPLGPEPMLLGESEPGS